MCDWQQQQQLQQQHTVWRDIFIGSIRVRGTVRGVNALPLREKLMCANAYLDAGLGSLVSDAAKKGLGWLAL